MTFEEAKKLLESATRWELRDHAFGDCEYGWELDGKEIAGAYSSGDTHVWIDGDSTIFGDEDSAELLKCGKNVVISRNDETGPDEYVEGQIMPGLTLEGVRKELTENG